MISPVAQEFTRSLPVDCGLLRADITSGKPIDQAEILSLAALAQALFVTVTIESRTLDRVVDCHGLWKEATGLFEELCSSLADINSDDQAINWLRSRLIHFRDQAADRKEMFTVSLKERLRHAADRGADFETSFTERHSIEPSGVTGHPGPAHVYSVGKF
jgi:hypothetical protein